MAMVIKILNRKLFYSLLLALFVSSCGKPKPNHEVTNLTGTKWIYSDKDWTYAVYFKPKGKLFTTHPNDKTKENDYWEQSNTIVNLYFNDKYSIYNGYLLGQDTIKGIARNETDSWEFTMIKKP